MPVQRIPRPASPAKRRSSPRIEPSRRALLAATLPTTALLALPALPAAAENTPVGPRTPIPLEPGPRGKGSAALEITAGSGGAVTVSAAGTPLVRLDGYRIAVGVDARSGTVELDETDGDVHTIRVAYTPTNPAYTASVTYRAEGPVLHAQWSFTGPDDADFGDGRIYRTLLGADIPEWATVPTEYPFPVSHWERDERGGVPFRVADAVAYFAAWNGGDTTAAFLLAGSHPSRRGDNSLHAPPQVGEGGTWTAEFGLRTDALVAEARAHFESCAQILGSALLSDPPLAVDIAQEDTYRVFDEGGVRTFDVGVYSRSGRRTNVIVTARNVDGRVLQTERRTLTPEPGTATILGVDLDLPGPRSYVHLEVTASSGTDRALVRSGAAVAPRHDFGPADGSIIGMGGFNVSRAPGASQLPAIESKDEEIGMWQRLGVRHLRNNWLTPEESDRLDIATAYQPAASPEQFAGDPDGFGRWLDRAFELGEGTGAAHYELLNEWNLQQGGIGVAHWAEEYTTRFLLPFRDEMDRRGIDARLTSMGLGSWDPAFVDGIREHGGWGALDGLAIHPGRGNFAADYDPVVVDDVDPHGEVWNFYGATRRAKAYLDEHGPDKELWLTELYAMTCPNRWWNDDERIATDSTFLTLLLSRAIGVTGLHWFQLCDGLWNDKYGIDPRDPEFHFGLLRADRSPKPSLLAFLRAAELLDGAEFLGFLESPHPDLHGLRFRDGVGPFWVLWSRQDGFLHFADHADGEDGFHPFPDPWKNHEKRTLIVHLPEGADLEATDVIGRDLTVAGRSRTPRIRVGSSPVVLRGELGDDLRGPGRVSGRTSLKLEDVEVRRGEGGVEITGTNRTGGETELHVETTPAQRQSFPLGKGAFAVTADGEVADGAQVRVFVERRRSGQVHRAEFYRSV